MCNDIRRQITFSYIGKNISLVLYCKIKHEWGEQSTRKERMGIVWLREWIWRLCGMRRKCETGRCPLCLGEEDAKHRLLKNLKRKRGENLYECAANR
jgi:hypothetical protein